MKNALLSVVLLLAAGLAFAQDPSDTIADGGSATIAQGADTKHTKGLGYRCAGAATITVTNDKGDTDGVLWRLVEARHGTVTVDISDCGFETFAFAGGLVADGDGRVILKASSSLRTVYFGSTYSSTVLPYDVAQFEVQVEGVKTTDVDIVFKDRFAILRTPVGYDWSIASDSYLTLADANSSANGYPTGPGDLLAKYYDANGVLDVGPDGLDLKEVQILAPNALTAGKTLKLGGSVSAKIYLCYYNDWWSIWGAKGNETERAKEAMRIKFNILLDGEKTALNTGDANCVHIDGDVSGTGKVNITAGGKEYSKIYFDGKYAVTGPLSSGQTPSSFVRLVFTNPEGYLGDATTAAATVKLTALQGLVYDLQGDGPYTANLASLTVPAQSTSGGKTYSNTNAAVAVSANTVLSATAFDGMVKVEDGLERIAFPGAARLYAGSTVYLASVADGNVDLSTFGDIELTRIVVPNGGNISFNDNLSGLTVEVEAGGTAVLGGLENDVGVTCAAGGRVEISDEGWMKTMDDDILMWLDATRAPTSTNLYAQVEKSGFKVGDVVTYKRPTGETVSSIDNWSDWREGRGGRFYNNTYENASSGFWLPNYADFYPHLMQDGPGGKAYVSLYAGNESCRFHQVSWPDRVNPKFAVMVFGSQHGGGSSLLYFSTKEYMGRDRSAASNPITTNATLKAGYVWVDGEAVDPTETGFSGGWQVVSLKIDKSVGGLGFSNTYTGTGRDSGNQNYGEILFFKNELTEAERQGVERYLARKWGIAYKGPAARSKVSANGEGTLKLDVPTELGGGFAGTLETSDGAGITFAFNPIPGEEAVTTAGDPAAWFDANYPGAFMMSTTTKHPLNVGRWYDRQGVGADGSVADGTLVAHYYNADARAPSLQKKTLADGVEVNWLDFSNVYGFEKKSDSALAENDVVQGNMLRFGKMPDNLPQTPVTVETRTIFIVQDSSKGGGTPILTKTSGDKALLQQRYSSGDLSLGAAALAAKPIWSGNSVTYFSDGATYLNGERVDGATQGFTGGPELLTGVAGPDKSFDVGCFGYYSATENQPYADLGEILGEVIAYDTALTDAQREDVEAYLMWKWLRRIRTGYDPIEGLSRATLSGAGSVTLSSLGATLPAFADGFAGRVTVSATELGFAGAGGALTAAYDFKGASVTFPAEVTVRVSGDLADGVYDLVKAGSIAPGTTFTAVYDGEEEVRLTLVNTGTALKLTVDKCGGLFIMFW